MYRSVSGSTSKEKRPKARTAFRRIFAITVKQIWTFQKCEVQLAYAIGVAEPVSLYINCFDTNTIPIDEIKEKILNKFSLTPKEIITYLDLRKPIYTKTTNYGHFGKNNLPWEKIIKF